MSDNVIRNDIIKLDFDISGIDEIKKMQTEINNLKRLFTRGLNDRPFEPIGESAEETVRPLRRIGEMARSVGQGVAQLGRNAGGTAVSGLQKLGDVAVSTSKKLAGISFKAFLTGLGASTVAVGGLVKQSVESYADYEQFIGGVETLFGAGGQSLEEYAKSIGKSVKKATAQYNKLKEAESIVFKNANDAFKTAGLSANDYMENVTSFSASLITSCGNDTKKAAELANVAMVDMSDNANKMGSDMESIQNAYQGFSKQNYTMLDNLKLGYGGTKEEMQRLIKTAAKTDKSIKANDMSFGNIVKSIHEIQKNMGIMGTTAKEAEGTISGSLGMVKSAWGNLMPALVKGGDSFDQCLDNLVYSATKFGENIKPAILKALSGVGQLIERMAPLIAEELPKLVDELLPPFIRAAVSLMQGLIRALPNIVKVFVDELPHIFSTIRDSLAETMGDSFLFKTFDKISNFFKDNADTITSYGKKAIPVVLGLVAAFKGFKVLQKIGSFFSFGSGGDSGGGLFSGILSTFKTLAKAKTTTIIKGMANLTIVLMGVTMLTAVFMKIAPELAKLTDMKSLVKSLASITLLGAVATALSSLAGIAGKIPVKTTVKGLANMAIVIGGMSILLLAIDNIFSVGIDIGTILEVSALSIVLGVTGTALSGLAGLSGKIKVSKTIKGLTNMAIVIGGMSAILFEIDKVFSGVSLNISSILQVAVLTTVLGVVGGALAGIAGIVGKISIGTVVKGFINMAIVIGGMSAIVWAIDKVFSDGINVANILKITIVIAALGIVGGVLAGIAGIIGLIPFPIVVSGLASIATVIGGLTALVAAYGELSKIDGFNELITSGGEALSNLFNQLGKMVGSLIGGVGEGITNSLPKIGENLSKFVKSIKPIFTMMKGVDASGVGDFFSSFGSFMLTMAGSEILSFFGGSTDLIAVGNQLSGFAHSAQSAFNCFSEFPDKGIENAPKILEAINGIGDYDFKRGGLAQAYSGEVEIGEIGIQLDNFAHNAQSAFNCFSEFPQKGIENAPKVLEAINGIGNYDFKRGGLAQLFTGGTDIGEIGIQLDNFAHNAQSAFNCFSEFPEAGITNAPRILDAINGIGNYDFKSGGLAQLFDGSVDIGSIGPQLDNFAHNTQSAFNCFSEFPEAGITNAPRVFDAVAKIQSLSFGEGSQLENLGVQLDNFSHKAQSAFNCFSEFSETSFQNATNLITSIKNLENIGKLELNTKNIDGLVSSLKNANSILVNLTISATKFPVALVSSGVLAFNLFVNALTQTFTQAQTITNNGLDKIVKKTAQLPQKMANAISSSGSLIANALTNALNSAVNAAQGPVNQLVNMARNVVTSFNSVHSLGPLPFSTIAGYANGTNGHNGGNALVNDGRGAELIQMPNGNAFIPNGKNVFIPNAPKGMKVFTAEQTAGIMGRKNPTYNYANGTGLDFAKMTGITYSPENVSSTSTNNATEYNTYAPQFNLTISGSNEDRETERKVKRWINEAMNEVFESMARKNPRLREV